MHPRYPIALLFAATLVAQNSPVIPDHYYRTFSHTNPVFQRIKPDQLVVTKTLDSGGHNERNEQMSPGSNPLTGPFYIEGAEAGDALVMHRNGLDVVRSFIQRVDELDIAVAAQAEYLRHLFLDQIIDNDLGTIEHVARRHRITLSRLLNVFMAGLKRRAVHPSLLSAQTLFLIILYVN